jgi:putative effector of murein hydrolase
MFSLQTFHFSMKGKNKRKISVRFTSNFFLFCFVLLPFCLLLFRLQYHVYFKGTAAAVSVLEAPVLGTLAMMSPAMQALEETTQHGVVSELEARTAAPQGVAEASEATEASASMAPVSLVAATSCKGRAE